MALGRKQHRDRITDNFVLIVSEQCLGRAIEREYAAGLVEYDDTVGRRGEHGFQFVHANVADAKIRFQRADPLRRVAFRQTAHEQQIGVDAVPCDGGLLQFNRQGLALACREYDRIGRFCRDRSEEARQTARCGEVLAIVVSGKGKHCPIGKHDVFTLMHERRNGKPNEQLPSVDS